jgi:hypothetical protein
VGVEHEDAQIRSRLEHLLQDDHHAVRLADPGGAEHREMLAEHLVDMDVRFDRDVLQKPADHAGRDVGLLVDEPEFLAREHGRSVPDARIFGDAAAEPRGAALARGDLAHQVHVGDGAVAAFSGGRRQIERDRGDHTDDPRIAAVDQDESRHRGARIPSAACGFDETDGGARATHRDDPSEHALLLPRRRLLLHVISAGEPPLAKL